MLSLPLLATSRTAANDWAYLDDTGQPKFLAPKRLKYRNYRRIEIMPARVSVIIIKHVLLVFAIVCILCAIPAIPGNYVNQVRAF